MKHFPALSAALRSLRLSAVVMKLVFAWDSR
jgi:hypothetical protein